MELKEERVVVVMVRAVISATWMASNAKMMIRRQKEIKEEVELKEKRLGLW